MEERNDDLNNYLNSFKNMKGHIHILERSVPVEIQVEYFSSSKYYRKSLPPDYVASDEECQDWYEELIRTAEETTNIAEYEAQRLLMNLACSKNPKGYRLIKQFIESNSCPQILDWAYLALMDIQINLESELSDEKQIYIATGLGGKGEKLRFYILFTSTTQEPFATYQRNVIEREFNYYFPQVNCEIEQLEIEDNHVLLLILIPIRTDIRVILSKIIAECNEYGNFLSEYYTITNVKPFTQEEINEVLRRHTNG